MKRIYVEDFLHEQLKKEAKQQGRSLRWVVEQKLLNSYQAQPDGRLTTLEFKEPEYVPDEQ